MVPPDQVRLSMTPASEHRPDARFLIEADLPSLIARAAERIGQAAESSISERDRFSIVLSGGSTPKALYEFLAEDPWRTRIEWEKTHLFWSDERWLPSSSPENNYRMTRDALISKIPIPIANVHPILTDSGTPEESAQAYEDEIRRFFGGASPEFDFVLLGVGTNGHTASLFPYRPTLHENSRLVIADYVEEVRMHRITLTAAAINTARSVAFLVTGSDKASVVAEVATGRRDPERLPAQLISPASGNLRWFLDSPAAANLPVEKVDQDL